MDFTGLKDLLVNYAGLERDALHIHVALLIYVVAALVLRSSRRSLLPWLIVFGIEAANEAHDLWRSWSVGENPVYDESLKDLWNTMLWPTVLMIVGRYTRWPRWRGRAQAEPALQDEDAVGADPRPETRPQAPPAD